MKSIALYYSTKCQKSDTSGDTNKRSVNSEFSQKKLELDNSGKEAVKKDDLKTELHVNIWKVEE